jgi:hypothetical protein
MTTTVVGGITGRGPSGRNVASGRRDASDRIDLSVPDARTVSNGRSVPTGPSARIGRREADVDLAMSPSTSRVAIARAASCLASATFMVIAAPATGRAQAEQWQVGTAPSFSSGTYGTGTRTEVLHTPTTIRRLFNDGDVAFVLPVTCVRGDVGVTVVSGSPVRTERAGSAATGSSGRTGASGTTDRTGSTAAATRGTTDAELRGSRAQTVPATSCGLGDIVVRGRYYLVDERGWAPTIALRAHVKAPTASAERGLGTGRSDEGVGVEISRTFAGGFTVMVDGGYTFIGTPAGADFNNSWWYDVGLGQNLADGLINVSAFLEEYRAIVSGLRNARELLAALTLKGPSGWRVQATALFGLSEGAPDHGLAIGASRRF